VFIISDDDTIYEGAEVKKMNSANTYDAVENFPINPSVLKVDADGLAWVITAYG